MLVLQTFLEDPVLREHLPAMPYCAIWFADDQIRRQATLVGNLVNASPAADGTPPMPSDERMQAWVGAMSGEFRALREKCDVVVLLANMERSDGTVGILRAMQDGPEIEVVVEGAVDRSLRGTGLSGDPEADELSELTGPGRDHVLHDGAGAEPEGLRAEQIHQLRIVWGEVELERVGELAVKERATERCTEAREAGRACCKAIGANCLEPKLSGEVKGPWPV